MVANPNKTMVVRRRRRTTAVHHRHKITAALRLGMTAIKPQGPQQVDSVAVVMVRRPRKAMRMVV